MIVELDMNAMWEAVKHLAIPSDDPWDQGAVLVGALDLRGNDPHRLASYMEGFKLRRPLTNAFAWTITDPATVTFVAEHAGRRVIDPMAGSGWWPYLLGEAGVNVLAYDKTPPSLATDVNTWHRRTLMHVRVRRGDGVATVRRHGAGRTLFLAWPPYASRAGADILAAYPGNRVVYIGESDGGCCGDERLFWLLGTHWTEVAGHRPVQWYGIHDYVHVFERTRPYDRERIASLHRDYRWKCT